MNWLFEIWNCAEKFSINRTKHLDKKPPFPQPFPINLSGDVFQQIYAINFGSLLLTISSYPKIPSLQLTEYWCGFEKSNFLPRLPKQQLDFPLIIDPLHTQTIVTNPPIITPNNHKLNLPLPSPSFSSSPLPSLPLPHTENSPPKPNP